ncbi:MAG: hypothetical protein KL785_01005 [Brevundimonas sp.]|nr:hypothetical protein [Brevundimonas sp.]
MSRKTDDKSAPPPAPRAGLVVGGLGGPEEELLESGQEEVFSRTEVESGRIEHQADTDGQGERPDGDRERSD